MGPACPRRPTADRNSLREDGMGWGAACAPGPATGPCRWVADPTPPGLLPRPCKGCSGTALRTARRGKRHLHPISRLYNTRIQANVRWKLPSRRNANPHEGTRSPTKLWRDSASGSLGSPIALHTSQRLHSAAVERLAPCRPPGWNSRPALLRLACSQCQPAQLMFVCSFIVE